MRNSSAALTCAGNLRLLLGGAIDVVFAMLNLNLLILSSNLAVVVYLAVCVELAAATTDNVRLDAPSFPPSILKLVARKLFQPAMMCVSADKSETELISCGAGIFKPVMKPGFSERVGGSCVKVF